MIFSYKYLITLATIVAIVGSALIIKNQIGNKNTPVINTNISQPQENKSDTATSLQIQAWMYPGEPACNARAELADGRKIDVIKPEYFSLSENGTLELLTVENFGCNAFSKENISYIKKYSREQFVTVSAHQIEMKKFFATQDTNDAVQTLNRFVLSNELTGIELDFEDFSAWSTDDYQNYISFAKSLGSTLNSNNKKLMLDGPAIATQEQQSWYKWRYEDFADIPVDYLLVMAYDYQADQGAGSPIAPNQWVTDSINWVKAKVSNIDKIIIGIPSYGYKGIEGKYDVKILTYDQLIKTVTGDKLRNAQRDSQSGKLCEPKQQQLHCRKTGQTKRKTSKPWVYNLLIQFITKKMS
jgi:spore germination protein YaaH